MINPNDFINPRGRKVNVSVDVKNVKEALDWSELIDIVLVVLNLINLILILTR